MSKITIIEGNSDDKDNVRVIMVKGEKGDTGDVNKAQLDAEIEARISKDSNLQNQINSLASGSPLVASSTAEMTDTTRTYVNTSDGKWYYYNGSAWTIGGTYQSAEDSNAVNELDENFDILINTLGNSKIESEKDKYISCTTSVINVNSPVSQNGYEYFLSPCVEGDTFIVKGKGGDSSRLWCFINSNGAVTSMAEVDALANNPIEVVAPSSSVYFISNNKYTEEYGFVLKGKKIDTRVSELKNGINDGSAFNDKSIKPTKLYGSKNVGNMYFDALKKENGKYYTHNNNGTYSAPSLSSYNTFLIKIEKNKQYTFDGTMRFVVLTTTPIYNLGDDSNFVSQFESVQSFNSGNAEYAQISYSSSISEPVISEGILAIADYLYSLNWLKSEVSKLEQKTVINFGDSIAENRTESHSYYYQLNEKAKTVGKLDYASGGATVSKITGQSMGCILEQIQTCVNNHPASSYSYDIALIDGGANDYSQNRDVGTVVKTSNHYSLDDYTATFDTTTFLGALEESFRILRNAYVSCIIVFVIPHKHNRLDNKWQSMVEGMRQACEKWSVACLDIDKEGQLNSRIVSMREQYTDNSGTHQNTLGNEKFYVPQLINILEKYF